MKMKFLFTIISACSNIQVMRRTEVITKDKFSWYLDNFSFLVPSGFNKIWSRQLVWVV